MAVELRRELIVFDFEYSDRLELSGLFFVESVSFMIESFVSRGLVYAKQGVLATKHVVAQVQPSENKMLPSTEPINFQDITLAPLKRTLCLFIQFIQPWRQPSKPYAR